MNIKTDELNGIALDYAVAVAEGGTGLWFDTVATYWITIDGKDRALKKGWAQSFTPSTNWAQGGPIIDREKITIVCAEGEYNYDKAGTPDCYDTYWVAEIGRQQYDTVYGPQGDDWGHCFQIYTDEMIGPTPLVAAMRCYVKSKLGDVVDIPNELLV